MKTYENKKLKVLFVYSGNSTYYNISPFVERQAKSLEKLGIDIFYFSIKGKGIKGYINNILPLRKKIKNGCFDIVHAQLFFLILSYS